MKHEKNKNTDYGARSYSKLVLNKIKVTQG